MKNLSTEHENGLIKNAAEFFISHISAQKISASKQIERGREHRSEFEKKKAPCQLQYICRCASAAQNPTFKNRSKINWMKIFDNLARNLLIPTNYRGATIAISKTYPKKYGRNF